MPAAQRQALAVDERLHPLAQLRRAVGDLLVGQALPLGVLGEVLLGLGDERVHERLPLHALVRGDLGEGLAALQRRAQLVLRDAEGGGGGVQAPQAAGPAPAVAAEPAAALRQRLVEGGRDLVGLLLGDRAVADQAGERVLDALEPVADGGGAAGGGRRGHGGEGDAGDDAAEAEGGREDDAGDALAHGDLRVG